MRTSPIFALFCLASGIVPSLALPSNDPSKEVVSGGDRRSPSPPFVFDKERHEMYMGIMKNPERKRLYEMFDPDGLSRYQRRVSAYRKDGGQVPGERDS
ncbi:hypothetical protein F5148DRAFT_1260849 [Russula earlei]|uniref:Uncharacterized protein n=1 Tax=Russula earlei TaxID=71964 RepID=A0ACC0TS08_9AGAM|nr:hypothetical protein F5148DRAFT_1260849 [Russula earlei]